MKLFGVSIEVSMKGDVELCLRLEPPCCVAVNNQAPKKRKNSRTGPLPKRRKVVGVQEPDRSIPPQLLEKVKSREGTTEPVFVYQRVLTEADTTEGQNRLFVLEREEFKKMLTEAEWGIVNGEGLKNIVGVDTPGILYKLGLKIWPSLDMLVIKSGWWKLVKQNDAKKDDWVQIWGHRDHIGNLCMAINFIKA